MGHSGWIEEKASQGALGPSACLERVKAMEKGLKLVQEAQLRGPATDGREKKDGGGHQRKEVSAWRGPQPAQRKCGFREEGRCQLGFAYG